MEAIKRACAAAGGQSAMAKALGVSDSTVSQWCTGRRPVPIDRMADIESACKGQVTRRDLLPDRWTRVWPELESASA